MTEWIAVNHPFFGVTALPPGRRIDGGEPDWTDGEEDVTDREVTLVVSGDESVAIEGNAADVLAFLDTARAEVLALVGAKSA